MEKPGFKADDRLYGVQVKRQFVEEINLPPSVFQRPDSLLSERDIFAPEQGIAVFQLDGCMERKFRRLPFEIELEPGLGSRFEHGGGSRRPCQFLRFREIAVIQSVDPRIGGRAGLPGNGFPAGIVKSVVVPAGLFFGRGDEFLVGVDPFEGPVGVFDEEFTKDAARRTDIPIMKGEDVFSGRKNIGHFGETSPLPIVGVRDGYAVDERFRAVVGGV